MIEKHTQTYTHTHTHTYGGINEMKWEWDRFVSKGYFFLKKKEEIPPNSIPFVYQTQIQHMRGTNGWNGVFFKGFEQ